MISSACFQRNLLSLKTRALILALFASNIHTVAYSQSPHKEMQNAIPRVTPIISFDSGNLPNKIDLRETPEIAIHKGLMNPVDEKILDMDTDVEPLVLKQFNNSPDTPIISSTEILRTFAVFELQDNEDIHVTSAWVGTTKKWKEKFAIGDMIVLLKRGKQTIDYAVFNDPRIRSASFSTAPNTLQKKILAHKKIKEKIGQISLSFEKPETLKDSQLIFLSIPFSFPKNLELDANGLNRLEEVARPFAEIDADLILDKLNQ